MNSLNIHKHMNMDIMFISDIDKDSNLTSHLINPWYNPLD